MFKSRASVFASEGEIHSKSGQYYKAIDFYTKAIENFPFEYRYYLERSICYEKIELFHLAKIDVETAIKLHADNPDIAKCYFCLGLACHGVRQFNEAEQAMKKVLMINGDHLEAKQELIRIRYSALISMGFESAISFTASNNYDSIADAVDALLSQVIDCLRTDDDLCNGYDNDNHLDDFKCNGQDEASPQQLNVLLTSSSRSFQPKVNMSNQSSFEVKAKVKDNQDDNNNNNNESEMKTKQKQQHIHNQLIDIQPLTHSNCQSNGFANSVVSDIDNINQHNNNNNNNNIKNIKSCADTTHLSQDKVKPCESTQSPSPSGPVRWADKAKSWAKVGSVQKSGSTSNNNKRPTNIWGYFGLRVENASIDNKKSLQKIFSRYGKLKGIESVKNAKASVWIYYDNAVSPVDAAAELNGTIIGNLNRDGKPLKMYFAPTNDQPELKFSRPKAPPNSQGECYYWRTTFCSSIEKNIECPLLHIQACKNIDEQIWMKDKAVVKENGK